MKPTVVIPACRDKIVKLRFGDQIHLLKESVVSVLRCNLLALRFTHLLHHLTVYVLPR